MPVTAGKRPDELSQRNQYAKGGIGKYYWDLRDSAVLRYINGPRILDAGCGEGITLGKIIAAFPGMTVQGVDIDERNIEICRTFGMPVQKDDLTSLSFDTGSFDTCVFTEVIEHLEEPEKALAELARVLRPGGRIIIVYPVDWAMWLARIICFKFNEARFDPAHLRQWTAATLAAILPQCGLTKLKSFGTPLPWPFMLHGVMVAQKN